MFKRFIKSIDWKKESKEWANAILIALVVALIIRTFFFQAYKIPSGSMRPTLMEGDKLFVNKIVYDLGSPQRGDIVVFEFPGDANNFNLSQPEDKLMDQVKRRLGIGHIAFIKRLVAFGGETVEIRDGKIYINDKILTEPKIFKDIYYYNYGPYGSPSEKIKVPENHYYVLGDNSGSSKDSRFWGFVPKKNLIGKAIFRWWPLWKIGTLDHESGQ